MDRRFFPMFLDLSGKKVTVAGGGKIALRRVKTLLAFGADICVVAPDICKELEELCGENIRILCRKYEYGDVDGSSLAVAATDDREVNRKIREECRSRMIPVNVADDRTLCDFYFPSVVLTDDVVIGICSGGTDPSGVKAVRRELEQAVHAVETLYDTQGS